MCSEENGVTHDTCSSRKICQSKQCIRQVPSHNNYCHRLVPYMLVALCKKNHSFEYFINSCLEIKQSVETRIYSDYYGGVLLRRLHSDMMRNYDSDKEIIIFSCSLLMVSRNLKEGMEIEVRGSLFLLFLTTICNILRASEALLTNVVPGTHDGDLFDSFLTPIIADLKKLEIGIIVPCYAGKQRLIRSFVISFTADRPSMSKITAYSSHSAVHTCRIIISQQLLRSPSNHQIIFLLLQRNFKSHSRC